MNCKAVREKLSLYLDGQLSTSDIKLVDEHTKICNSCRDELSSLEETVNLVRSLEPIEMPHDLTDRIIRHAWSANSAAAIKTQVMAGHWQRAWRQWGRSLSSVAAVLIAAVLIAKVTTGPGLVSFTQVASEDAASGYVDDMGPEMMSFIAEEEQEQMTPRLMMKEATPSSPVEEPLPLERKVIQTAHLTLQVEKLDTAVEQLQQLVQECQGFIQNSNMFRHDSGLSSHYTLRIPVYRFTNVLTQLEALGDVQEKSLTGQDVTDEYVDTDARHRNLIRQEERLLTILDRAETVEDILKVEGQLERVRGEIEALTGRLRYLDNQVELSTINVELRERLHRVTAVQLPNKKSLGARITQALTSSVNWLLSSVSNIVVWIVGALPILTVVGALAFLIRWLWKRFRNQ